MERSISYAKSLILNSIPFVFLLVLILLALKYPGIGHGLIAFISISFSIFFCNYKINPSVIRLVKLFALTLVVGFVLGSLNEISLQQLAIPAMFKLQRFFTLPTWLFTVLFLLFIFPELKRWRVLAISLHQSMFHSRALLTLLFLTLLFSQLLTVGSQVIAQGTRTLRFWSTPVKERYALRSFGVGEAGWFYRVGQFWDETLPRNQSVVVGIPPQGDPWIKSGNVYYVLSFLTPRKVKMLSERLTEVPLDVTHLVIARGETDTGDFGWPKEVIPSDRIEKITSFNPFTGETQTVQGVPYEPEKFASVYGMITLKKEIK